MHKLIFYFKNILTNHFKVTILSLILLTTICYFITFLWVWYFIPDDYLQGELVKIMYIHVPCAWLSLITYIILGGLAISYLIYSNAICNLAIDAALVVSLNTCFITLGTGSIWGKAAWGTWWVWDPRLTAVFIQFCILSICYIIRNTDNNNEMLSKSSAMIIILGLINIPIIKFAVNAWNSIHQDSSFFSADGPKIDTELLLPLMMAFFSISCFYFTIGLALMKNKMLYLKQYRKMINEN